MGKPLEDLAGLSLRLLGCLPGPWSGRTFPTPCPLLALGFDLFNLGHTLLHLGLLLGGLLFGREAFVLGRVDAQVEADPLGITACFQDLTRLLGQDLDPVLHVRLVLAQWGFEPTDTLREHHRSDLGT